MKEISRIHSIYMHLALLVAAALAATLVTYYSLYYALGRAVDAYRSDPAVTAKLDKSYIKKLKSYVRKNGIGTDDTEKINAWVTEQKVLSIQILKDGKLIYDSDYSTDDPDWEPADGEGIYDWVSDSATVYDVSFDDGTAQVAIYGYYNLSMYNIALLISMVAAFGVMMLIVLIGISRTVRYIVRLSREVEILEGGHLDYPITVKGRDELALLAQNLDNMRRTFREQSVREEELQRKNQTMVTEMSHDLRTPLTSILLYTEILKNGRFSDRSEAEDLLNRIEEKVYRMKDLAETLLNYSIHPDSERRIELEKEDFADAFYEMQSETASYLARQGIRTQTEMEWRHLAVAVQPDYPARIFENLVSNLVKYADRSVPAEIRTVYPEGFCGFVFRNRTAEKPSSPESTGVGLDSVRSMMNAMGGRCRAVRDGDFFETEILFARWQDREEEPPAETDGACDPVNGEIRGEAAGGRDG